MCFLGDGHLILKGIWNLFFRNKYSGQVTSKNKINILSCHETKRNTAHIDDLIINEQNISTNSLVTIRAKEVLFRFFLHKYIQGFVIVTSLLAKGMVIFLTEYTYKCCCLFSINNKRATC